MVAPELRFVEHQEVEHEVVTSYEVLDTNFERGLELAVGGGVVLPLVGEVGVLVSLDAEGLFVELFVAEQQREA